MTALMEGLTAMSPIGKGIMDMLAVSSALISFFLVALPALTTLASFIWICLRIYEAIQGIKRNNREEED